jgi:hypothetical protein
MWRSGQNRQRIKEGRLAGRGDPNRRNTRRAQPDLVHKPGPGLAGKLVLQNGCQLLFAEMGLRLQR